MREIVTVNITRIVNYINTDLEVVFPEFIELLAIDSKTGLAILKKFTTPNYIFSLSKDKLLNLMKKEGRNH